MGKEWLYWGGGGGGCKSTKREKFSVGERNTPTPGCMCVVLQLFDFHHYFHFPSLHKPHAFLSQQTPTLKGLEAPRNSLESAKPSMGAASLSSIMKKDEKNLTIPMGIQIKTSNDIKRTRTTDDLSSDCISSPSIKTPLVARLMGLDLLFPSSPSSSISNRPLQRVNTKSQTRINTKNIIFDVNITGTRSLPETPRISLERKSDVDRRYHRPSLQINKENVGNLSQEFEFRERRVLKVLDENTQSTSNQCGKEIVKRVKEDVSRRVGFDITNTIKNRDDINVVLIKTRKPSSSSPKRKQVKRGDFRNQNSHTRNLSSLPLSTTKVHLKNPTQKCKLIKQEETFVGSSAASRAKFLEKKCKKIPIISNEIFKMNVPILVPMKKGPSSPSPKLPQKQKQISDALSSNRNRQLHNCLSHPYQQEVTHKFNLQEINNHDRSYVTTTTTAGEGAEYRYITRILKCYGIDKNTLMYDTKWYSLSHPLDPSIFYYLELIHPHSKQHQKNKRKLIFQLVDEILGEILKTHFNLKRWVGNASVSHGCLMCGSELIEAVWGRIRNFPLYDCRVLEDIDALVNYDLCRSTTEKRSVGFDDADESIVSEIEGDIVDSLAYETAMVVFWCGMSVQ